MKGRIKEKRKSLLNNEKLDLDFSFNLLSLITVYENIGLFDTLQNQQILFVIW